MKLNKDEALKLLDEPSTYAGIAVVIVALFGLEAFSPEQVAVAIAGLVGIFKKEKINR